MSLCMKTCTGVLVKTLNVSGLGSTKKVKENPHANFTIGGG